MIAATSLSSRVTLNVPVRARAVSTRAARAAVVRVAADGEESSGYKSMNVTKPNIVNNLDGETTRNIDGKVYTITVKGDDVTVKDKFGQVFPARVNKAAIVEADLSNSVAGANTMSIGGMNFALAPDQVTGFQERTETINGRAAMVGFLAAVGAELATQDSIFKQLGEGGLGGMLFVFAAVSAASFAPIFNGRSAQETFLKGRIPDEFGPFNAQAEMLNGRAAMMGLLFLLAAEASQGQAFF